MNKMITVTISEGETFENLARQLREQGVIITEAADEVIQHAIGSKHIPFYGECKVAQVAPEDLGFRGEDVSVVDFYNKAIEGKYLPVPFQGAMKIRGLVTEGSFRFGMEPVTDGSGWDYVFCGYSQDALIIFDVEESGMYGGTTIPVDQLVWFRLREEAVMP